MKISTEAAITDRDALKVYVRVEGTKSAWIRFAVVRVPFEKIDGALPHVLQQWRLQRDDESPPWEDCPLF